MLSEFDLSLELIKKDLIVQKMNKKINLNLNLKFNFNFKFKQINFDVSHLSVIVQKNNLYNLINCVSFFDSALMFNKAKLNFNSEKDKKTSNKNLIKTISFLNKNNFYLFYYQLQNSQQKLIFENTYQFENRFNFNNFNLLLRNVSYHNNTHICYSSERDWTLHLSFNFKHLTSLKLDEVLFNPLFSNLVMNNLKLFLKII